MAYVILSSTRIVERAVEVQLPQRAVTFLTRAGGNGLSSDDHKITRYHWVREAASLAAGDVLNSTGEPCGWALCVQPYSVAVIEPLCWSKKDAGLRIGRSWLESHSDHRYFLSKKLIQRLLLSTQEYGHL
ncbi:hypothetical protein DPMN_102578 [Dreissena polymorpha]|uniref:Uncharacterized protein n=1 Tax=Dreissena polymorpha TaxID=45954 RepID=A0A9D4RB02_DREPO|nr:hypothetical protein DPMN_102578 [Dreissena polymorpha]